MSRPPGRAQRSGEAMPRRRRMSSPACWLSFPRIIDVPFADLHGHAGELAAGGAGRRTAYRPGSLLRWPIEH